VRHGRQDARRVRLRPHVPDALRVPSHSRGARCKLRAAMDERVVVSLTSSEQEYQALQGEDALAAGRRLAANVEVLYAEDNAVVQIHQLFRFVHAPEPERPLALVLHTRAPDGLERVARNAARAGIGWLLLNRTAPYLEALRREAPPLDARPVTTAHSHV